MFLRLRQTSFHRFIPVQGVRSCLLGLAAIGAILTSTQHAAGQTAPPPQVKLDNGLLHVVLDLPDSVRGAYQGTRFDWSGVISELTFAGHSYYGPWYSSINPSIRDFNYSGQDLIVGKASAITGPAEEFMRDDGTALGYNEAKPGGTFVNIGVGTLRKPDGDKYSPYRIYDIVDSGNWKFKTKRFSVEFTQKIIDKSSGYGYLYTKTVRLEPGQPRMFIEHSLKNIGRLTIDTQVFDHNFLVLDHQPSGPGFVVTLPYTIQIVKPIKEEMGGVEGNRIFYRRQPGVGESFVVHTAGFRDNAQDNDIRIENENVGAGMRITGDHALFSEELWSIRTTLAMEPYIKLKAEPGQTIHWSYTYLYYTLPVKK